MLPPLAVFFVREWKKDTQEVLRELRGCTARAGTGTERLSCPVDWSKENAGEVGRLPISALWRK
jgi:hypothetical protein